MVKKRACVIGSGFGGMSAAIRLQSQGFETEIFEKRDLPGGRAYVFKDKGFTFDAGPTVITAPHCLEELFELSGRNIKDYVELIPVEPFYRLAWEDGYQFDYGSSLQGTLDQIAAISPRDVEGYKRFLQYSKEVFSEGYTKLVHVPFLSIWSMIKVAPQLLRLQAFRSVYSMVSKFIINRKLREAFSFHSLLVGGNPFSSSSIYTLIHYLERNWGVTFPRGGTGALVRALVMLFEDLGGKIHLNAEIKRIVTANGSVIGIETRDGRFHSFDLVVSNADVVHTYNHLLQDVKQVAPSRSKSNRMRQSMSLFLIYFGTKKQYPQLAHHTVVFGPRYKELLSDIFDRQILADDFSLYLHAPTRTDSKLAPEGCEAFYVLSPVPHLEKNQIDWQTQGPLYADKILTYLQEHLIPGLKNEIVTQRLFTPEDFKTELNAHQGTAFSFAPTLLQSAYFRAHNRDANLRGLYFVGAGTHPGAGIPGVVNSAKATVSVIIEDFAATDQATLKMSHKAIQAGSKSFSLAARFFGIPTQEATSQVYAWCRYCDDQIDEGKGELSDLVSKTQALYEEQLIDHPVFAGFQRTIRKYKIPKAYPLDLLQGMEMDRNNFEYKSIEDLKLYCYRVAGTVGLMMSHVMGVTDKKALSHACDLGIAMQLTNIARDIVEDAKLGRVYLPQSWLQEVGLERAQILKPEHHYKVALLAHQLVRLADQYYQSGNAGLKYLQLRPALAVSAASRIYRAIGHEVVRRGSHAWDQRVVIGFGHKLFLILGTLTSVLMKRAPRIFLERKPIIALTEVWRFKS